MDARERAKYGPRPPARGPGGCAVPCTPPGPSAARGIEPLAALVPPAGIFLG
ncbi:hypothetical protein roselon_03044 [Roseibacterium elongatum DSM 19469]|uniref:Uncharacterized protein n=1 Tax=Roseicyclus elongatus DSM 19469 TaxID=1294273 RepID=W8SS07_9RHOB|nr:hypothetical protein roselon_03044 [Roseibacterium elongatum DSM 19469]